MFSTAGNTVYSCIQVFSTAEKYSLQLLTVFSTAGNTVYSCIQVFSTAGKYSLQLLTVFSTAGNTVYSCIQVFSTAGKYSLQLLTVFSTAGNTVYNCRQVFSTAGNTVYSCIQVFSTAGKYSLQLLTVFSTAGNTVYSCIQVFSTAGKYSLQLLTVFSTAGNTVYNCRQVFSTAEKYSLQLLTVFSTAEKYGLQLQTGVQYSSEVLSTAAYRCSVQQVTQSTPADRCSVQQVIQTRNLSHVHSSAVALHSCRLAEGEGHHTVRGGRQTPSSTSGGRPLHVDLQRVQLALLQPERRLQDDGQHQPLPSYTDGLHQLHAALLAGHDGIHLVGGRLSASLVPVDPEAVQVDVAVHAEHDGVRRPVVGHLAAAADAVEARDVVEVGPG